MGVLKVKPEHIAALAEILKPFYNTDTVQVYKEQGLSEGRYLHDPFYVPGMHQKTWPTISEIYKYANDTHIESALKHIAKDIHHAPFV